jgi:hypothetical protein
MKRFTRAALLSTFLILGGSAVAHAGEDWCTSDPALPIRTPGGSNVVVYVTNSALGSQHLASLQQAAISYVATPAAGGSATDVVVSVLIPGDLSDPSYAVRSVVSSSAHASGTIYETKSGSAGTVMQLSFRLNVA